MRQIDNYQQKMELIQAGSNKKGFALCVPMWVCGG